VVFVAGPYRGLRGAHELHPAIFALVVPVIHVPAHNVVQQVWLFGLQHGVLVRTSKSKADRPRNELSLKEEIHRHTKLLRTGAHVTHPSKPAGPHTPNNVRMLHRLHDVGVPGRGLKKLRKDRGVAPHGCRQIARSPKKSAHGVLQNPMPLGIARVSLTTHHDALMAYNALSCLPHRQRWWGPQLLAAIEALEECLRAVYDVKAGPGQMIEGIVNSTVLPRMKHLSGIVQAVMDDVHGLWEVTPKEWAWYVLLFGDCKSADCKLMHTTYGQGVWSDMPPVSFLQVRGALILNSFGSHDLPPGRKSLRVHHVTLGQTAVVPELLRTLLHESRLLMYTAAPTCLPKTEARVACRVARALTLYIRHDAKAAAVAAEQLSQWPVHCAAGGGHTVLTVPLGVAVCLGLMMKRKSAKSVWVSVLGRNPSFFFACLTVASSPDAGAACLPQSRTKLHRRVSWTMTQCLSRLAPVMQHDPVVCRAAVQARLWLARSAYDLHADVWSLVLPHSVQAVPPKRSTLRVTHMHMARTAALDTFLTTYDSKAKAAWKRWTPRRANWCMLSVSM
jgi:hypothetical protein